MGRDKIEEYLIKGDNNCLCLLFRYYICPLKGCFVIIKKGEIVGFVPFMAHIYLILMITKHICFMCFKALPKDLYIALLLIKF